MPRCQVCGRLCATFVDRRRRQLEAAAQQWHRTARSTGLPAEPGRAAAMAAPIRTALEQLPCRPVACAGA